MDDFERRFQRPIKPEAIMAFVVAVGAAYAIQVAPIGLGGGRIFTTLLVAAAGGLWYKVRNVL